MSMNDGGWDDAGFDGGSGGNDGGWGAPPAGGPSNQRPTHAAPAWTRPKVIVPVAGVAVAAIVVLVVLLATGGNPAPTAATPPPSTSSTPKPMSSTPTTPKKSPTTPKSTAPKLVSLAEYDKNVDRICADDGPKLQRAQDRHNLKSLQSLFVTEYSRLQRVQTPDDDGDQARQWINDLVKSAQASSFPKYEADAKATNALAKSLGMRDCQKALPLPGN